MSYFQKKLAKVKDVPLRKALSKYIKRKPVKNSYDKNLKRKLIIFLADEKLEELSWESLCKQLYSDTFGIKMRLIKFYGWLVINKLYQGKYQNYLFKNSWILTNIKGLKLKKFFYVGSKAVDMIQRVSSDKNSTTRLDLNADSDFIRNLLKKYINTLTFEECQMTRNRDFIFHFENSLIALEKKPEKIQDFNFKTFKKQYRFYKAFKSRNHQSTYILTKFYIYLIDYVEENNIQHKIFLNSDGIDRIFLLKQNFSHLYDNGYRVVYYNKFDEVPKSNRWLLAPNGAAKRSIIINNNDYFPIDFLRVKDKKMRNATKLWFWNRDLSMSSKKKKITNIFLFLETLYDFLRENSSNIIDINKKRNKIITSLKIKKISLELISKFRLNLYKYKNKNVRNTMVSTAKDFIEFLYNNDIYKVEYGVFDYLKGFRKEEFKGNPIPKDVFKRIVEFYKSNYKTGGVDSKLQWIILNLASTTNIRLGEVLNLKRDCIDIKNQGRKVIDLQRKGSNGVYEEYDASQYAIRLIEDAINLTDQYLSEANKEVKKFVFIRKNQYKRIDTINTNYFYNKFKIVLKELGIKENYTAYNLRDTFMTNIIEEGKKKDKNLLELHTPTGHQSIRTTLKHYTKSDLKDYLEAMYYVKIGDVNLKGKIVDDLEKFDSKLAKNKKKITVNKQCGYCEAKECINFEIINCLLCDKFIATLDRIPYFKSSIKDIDQKINSKTLLEQKQKLVSIKKLYVEYLKELYSLKNEKENKL